ncbi:MAG: hypothetical protein PVI57_01320 [Gemmatimonadota bacterium]|jgi:hypothetical protein
MSAVRRAARVAGAVALLATCLRPPPVLGQETREPEIPQELLRGREVRFDHLGLDVRGELLAVSEDSLWVETATLRSFPLRALERVSVRRHGLDGNKAWLWTGTGAVVTAVALTAACSSVDERECWPVVPIVLLSWGLVGGLASHALDRSSRMELMPDPGLLRPFARFPQGLPEGFRVNPPGVP